ncbi:MAG TPA: hypothetical protein VF626_00660 [Chthoniobacterales bacterium]|jgi:hypothetical protein
MELLKEDRQSELLAQPESGMGYQIVDVVFRDGKRHRGTAFNGEFLLYSGEPLSRLQGILEPSRRLRMLERGELGLGDKIAKLEVIPHEAPASTRVRENSGTETDSPSSGANEAPDEESEKDEQFKRFSAFANDRRVTPAGGLSPGTSQRLRLTHDR